MFIRSDWECFKPDNEEEWRIMSNDALANFAIIRDCLWFTNLPEIALKVLASRAYRKRYRDDQFLYRVGERQTNLFCVLSGRIRVNVTGLRGQEFVLANLSEGAWLGEAAIAGNQSRMLAVRVDMPAEMLVLPAAAVVEVANAYPLVYRNLFNDTMNRSGMVYELFAGILFLSLKARLAGRILWLAEQYGETTEAGLEIKTKLSQTDLANMTMGSRQRVNKTLRAWTTEGVLGRDGGHYVIYNIAGLYRDFMHEH
ncbi:hypothetical protein GCM10008090_08860 [Arenicella chitinivorans]|uniref:Crp/Fnr family transcriptional regulator n=1 Tax=Arenicella chitinivorans TaxID=1329800 RepID=A0A918RKQ1_9GAMM|nr:Crp/Fnr family transcriptional regulator [Arenicella chitinivorans]GHA01879.1 hypothetical protein GCM10008090_08860 [Arenicella chitinivorans]